MSKKAYVCALVAAVLLAGTVIGVPFAPAAEADEMETVLQGPQTTDVVEDETEIVSPEPEVEETGPDAGPMESTSWFSRAVKSVGKFFKSMYYSVAGWFDSLGSGPSKIRGFGRVDASVGLTMRDGPGSEHEQIGTLDCGDEVEVVGAKNDFYRVKTEKGEAWVSGRYVSIYGLDRGGAGEVAEAEASNAAYVNVPHGLNMRDAPGMSGKRIHILKSEAEVTVLEKKRGWVRVRYGEVEGWVYEKCITAGKAPVQQDTGSTASKVNVRVDVPMRTQYEKANGKYQKSWCGPTSLAMVYEYHGKKETTYEVAKRIYDFDARVGTFAKDIVKDAKRNGFKKTRVKTGVDFDFLEKELKAGNPVIVGVEVAWQSGHYMVVVGLEGDKVIVNDPGRSGVQRTFSRSWFLTQWNGRDRRSIVVKK